MVNKELLRSPEAPQQKLDAIIVLGENIKKGWGPKEIRSSESHLSPYSRANVLAAAILLLQGATDRLIFSTGHTSGKNVPSEAKAMLDFYRRIMQPMPAPFAPACPSIILEEKSLTTSGNAREVKKLLKSLEEKGNIPTNAKVGLLVPGFHLKRADDRFREQKIQVTPIATEDILEQVLPGIKDKFMNPNMVAQELKREKVIIAIEKLPLVTLLTSVAARVTRK